MYFPDVFSEKLNFHIGGFVFSVPRNRKLIIKIKNSLTLKDNLLNEVNPKTDNLLSKNIFKISQENLVKTAIENYKKKING